MHYTTFSDRIEITLPITTPTGKVSVKRLVPGHAPEPVACRTASMADGDYLEWQISYDTDSLQDPSVLRDVILNKPKGGRYGCELVRLVVEACKIDLLQDDAFERLRGIAFSPLQHGIEETEQIIRESGPQPENLATKYGFSRHRLLVPNYLRDAKTYSVEIKIAHKQRAVGNQAMIFVHLPLRHCVPLSDSPLLGRCAQKLEKVSYVIDSKNVSIISDTVIAFSLASSRHHSDMEAIFRCI
ncbi:R.Pab1 family restriction endonuclease [bacterium]|nr:R.Pab1 family restriction endonuclease [bacterium]